MKLWNSFCAIAPHLIFSCLVLVASIVLPFAILLAALDCPITNIVAFVPSVNELKRMSDVMLIIVPLCVLYFLFGLMFAYHVGKAKTVPEGLFVTSFIVPLTFLALLQFPLYYYIIVKNEARLSGAHYRIAEATVYGVVASLIWVELFMAFVRAKSRILQSEAGSGGSVSSVVVP